MGASRAKQWLAQHGAPGLEPFDMPLSTIRALAKDERNRRAGHEPTIGAAASEAGKLANRLLAISQREVLKLERAQRKGNRADPARVQAWARAIQDAHKLAAAAGKPEPKTTPAPRIPATDDTPDGDDLLARMAADPPNTHTAHTYMGMGGTAPDSPPLTPQVPRQTAPPDTTPDPPTEAEGTRDVVHARARLLGSRAAGELAAGLGLEDGRTDGPGYPD